MKTQINPPQNWQDFEDLCHKLWRAIWGDINAQKNGRQGQSQNGVDIYGIPIYGRGVHGVQCKGKTINYNSNLTEEELNNESKSAENFNPQIVNFTIATTSPRDTSIQKRALEITNKRERKFPVSVWSWDDISDELQARPDVYQSVYNQPIDNNNSNEIHLGRLDKGDRLYAFLTRPVFKEQISPSLIDILGQFIFEICDNTFRHNTASYINIKFTDNQNFILTDDGKPFNPFTELRDNGNGGYMAFKKFLNLCQDELTTSYKSNENKENVTTLRFNNDFLKSNLFPKEIEYPKKSNYYDTRDEGIRHADEDINNTLIQKQRIKLLIKEQGALSGHLAYLTRICQTIPDYIDSVSIPESMDILEQILQEHQIKYKTR